MLIGRISRTMSSLPEGGRHRKAQALPLPRMVRSQTRDSRGFLEDGEQKSKNLKGSGSGKEVGIVEHPLSGSQWNRGHFSMRKWESEKHKNSDTPAEGFKGQVATDGSLLGNAGEGRTCGRGSSTVGLR